MNTRIAARATQRFATSTGPDGLPWKANAMATINAYIASKNGFGKRGINKKGLGLAMSKKPLIATRGLSRSIHYQIINGGQGVEIGTNRFADKIYLAPHYVTDCYTAGSKKQQTHASSVNTVAPLNA